LCSRIASGSGCARVISSVSGLKPIGDWRAL
jgi:hypothetical protein